MTGALDDFWSASSLTVEDVAAFAARVGRYRPADEHPHPFIGPGAPQPLKPVGDRWQRMIAARRSDRAFAAAPLAHRAVERLLASVGPTPDGRRAIPEAGGLDAVHVYLVAHQVEGPLAGSVHRYDHRHHVVASVGPCPDEAELRRVFTIDDDADTAAAIVVFVLDDRELRRKYGDRGGRFGWQQVGHAAQNVCLRLAIDGLRGYVLGGGLDGEILDLVGLGHTRARYGGAVACGV
ncbi:MAG: nitroreductase family protein [Desertimonas sp.]